MTTYVNPYTGLTINPSDVGYESIALTANTTLQWPINGNTTSVVASIIEVTASFGGASFTASFSGTTMTVTAVTSGLLAVGQTLTGTNIAAGTTITAFISSSGTTGTYTVSVSQTISSEAVVASPLLLSLPPATQVSQGQSLIVRNIGSYSFTVTDNSGNTIVSSAPGVASFIYLTDNTSVNGVWSTVTFGAGTSSANAATLAGYGLQAINTALNTVTPVTSISSSYTFSALSQSALYVWTGGTGTITLPLASVVPNGWFVAVKNDGTGTVTITPTGGNTIDGSSNAQLQLSESFVLVSNGTNWYSYGYGQSSLFVFTELTVNVTGGAVSLTATQAQSVIQQYQGVLTSNCTVTLPPIVQFYALSNNTTNGPGGPYTLTFTTGISGGSNITLAQGQTVLAVCDGKYIYNSQTTTSSTAPSLTVNNGSYAAPSLNFTGDTSTGMYLAASGQLGFAVGGSNGMTLTASGLLVPVGIGGGAF